jgi:IclR family transcriptional regulator, blcABC operon repressor
VTRALRILTLLADTPGEPIPLGDIARGIGAAKSSTYNLCQALEEGGMIVRTATGYLLGRRIAELGGAYITRFNPVREFYPICAEAALLRHELVQIAVLDGTDVLYLARHEGQAPMRMAAGIGSRFAAAPTAMGNALLTMLSDSEIAGRFSGPQHFPRLTERSTQDLNELLAKVRAARVRGYAIDDNGVHKGVYCVATAIPPWATGEQPLAIGATLMADRINDDFVEAVAGELLHAARQLSNPMVPNSHKS